MGKFLIAALVVGGALEVGFRVIRQEASGEDAKRLERGRTGLRIGGICLAGFLVQCVTGSRFQEICLYEAAAGLLLAAGMDLRLHMVYRFIWWLALPGAFGLMAGALFQNSLELALFFLLQRILFSRFYGRADCRSFCICAMIEYGFGLGMLHYLLQMLLAIFLLACHQAFRRNIGRNGNLLVPAPFVPYILLSFLAVMTIFTRYS